MRNYLKYPPLEWRKRTEYCVPMGPSFRMAPQINLKIAGNRLALKAPKNSPRYSSDGYDLATGYDVLKGQDLERFSISNMPNNHWGYAIALRLRWAFWGPWMTGCKAELSMAISVIGRQSEYIRDDISLFHPRVFEMVIAQYLNDLYGHENRGGNQNHLARYHGPVDWQTCAQLPVFGATCKIYMQSKDLKRLFNPTNFLFFPISDKHFVQISFKQKLYSKDSQGNLAFDPTPVQALQDAIFNSIRLELSPEHQASYDKIKAEIGDMELTKEFAPLKWPIEEKDSKIFSSDAISLDH